jgi:hypothetical protein
MERLSLLITVDRAVREHKRPPLAAENLRFDTSKEKFGCLLRVSDTASTLQEIPGDLERVLYEGW